MGPLVLAAACLSVWGAWNSGLDIDPGTNPAASLYAIAIASRRPLRPYAVTLVAGAILLLTYAASLTEFMTQR